MRFRQKTKEMPLGPTVKHRGPVFAAGLLTATIMACAPVIDNRGYFFDDRSVDSIEKGVTKKEAVRETFGSPSSESVLNNGAYYYIYSRFVTESYRAPEEVDRKVLAIYFDEDKIVRDFAVYGLEDGIIVPVVARTTQTQGSELTALQQIFGNVGRFGDGSPTQF
ncbi:MAG TPA: outer membrane protein assembly factor BamE [Rhodobiaceae bacterium]|nr:outer membrane protein assembly factor BamE [Rhodobiaceae bacterium]|tara:strand:- start:605 stop:1099 length:495 start_codon:yes stop_codon:yes gene_type:complete